MALKIKNDVLVVTARPTVLLVLTFLLALPMVGLGVVVWVEEHALDQAIVCFVLAGLMVLAPGLFAQKVRLIFDQNKQCFQRIWTRAFGLGKKEQILRLQEIIGVVRICEVRRFRRMGGLRYRFSLLLRLENGKTAFLFPGGKAGLFPKKIAELARFLGVPFSEEEDIDRGEYFFARHTDGPF